MFDDVEVGRYALRSFGFRTNLADFEFVAPVVEKLGWWTDGRVRYWVSPSYHIHGDWLDGTCTAVCANGSRSTWGGRIKGAPGHEAPNEDCHCGIYGSLSYADLLGQFREYARHIVTVIAAEGTTIIGDRGLRTAYARVVAFWACEGAEAGLSGGPNIARVVAREQFDGAKEFPDPLSMCEEYGLPLLPPPDPKGTIFPGRPNWWTSKRPQGTIEQ